jgi:hypothetical protein
MIVGGAAFLLSHVLMVFSWASFSPGAGYRPWFLNAGRAVLFTAIWLLAAAAVDSALAASTRRDALVRGANVAAGAFLAMVIVIVAAGPGTLFPIALAIGAAIALICAVSGALVGWSVQQTPRAGARK